MAVPLPWLAARYQIDSSPRSTPPQPLCYGYPFSFRFEAFSRAFRGQASRAAPRRAEGTRLLSATLHLILRVLHRRWHFYAPAMTSAPDARRHPVTCARRKLTVLCNPIRSLRTYIRYIRGSTRRRAEKRGEKKGKESRFVRDQNIRCGKRRNGWLGNERAPYRLTTSF